MVERMECFRTDGVCSKIVNNGALRPENVTMVPIVWTMQFAVSPLRNIGRSYVFNPITENNWNIVEFIPSSPSSVGNPNVLWPHGWPKRFGEVRVRAVDGIFNWFWFKLNGDCLRKGPKMNRYSTPKCDRNKMWSRGTKNSNNKIICSFPREWIITWRQKEQVVIRESMHGISPHHPLSSYWNTASSYYFLFYFFIPLLLSRRKPI